MQELGKNISNKIFRCFDDVIFANVSTGDNRRIEMPNKL